MRKPRKPLLRLFADSRSYWPGMAALAVVCLLSGAFQSAAALLLGDMVDLGLAGAYAAMLPLAGALIGVLLLDWGRTALHFVLIAHTFEGMFVALRARVFAALTRGSMLRLEQSTRVGDLASRVNSDLADLSNTVSRNFTWFLRVGMEAAVGIASCLYLSWQLALVYFCVLPLSAYLMKRISAPIQRRQKQFSGSLGGATSLAADVLSNAEVTKAYGLQAEMDARYGAAVDAATDQAIQGERVASRVTLLKYLVNLVQLMSLFIAGTLFVAQGWVSVGSVLAFVTLSASVRAAVELSDQMLAALRRGTALAERVYEVLDIPPEAGGASLTPVPGADYAHFEAVSFGYGGERAVFSQLSLRLRLGQKVGIVGPSGAGKSTILKLICRFYAATEGRLTLFGHAAQAWDPEALRRRLALVTQEPSLFDGTILDNLRRGREAATEQQAEAALREAQLWQEVQALPEGLHTPIGEFGAALSGGQKQRLAIARAILKDADMVLLDEPTSALDTISERELQRSLDRLLTGKTALIVAHRLSTLKGVDYIYCLDETGRIAEQGTLDALMDRKGYFYQTKIKQEQGG